MRMGIPILGRSLQELGKIKLKLGIMKPKKIVNIRLRRILKNVSLKKVI